MEKNDKCRICRRAGEKLFLKGDKCYLPSCPVTKRPYAPGQGGARSGRKKVSDYAKQLLEKQKARAIYQVSEKQMSNYFAQARKKKLSTGNELINLLENRVDNMIFRSGLASTRGESRQMVTHGNVLVNDKKIQSPSLQLKVGDKVRINAKLKKEIKGEALPWLKISKDNLEFELINAPDIDSMTSSINIQLIIEFYSR